MVGSVGGDKSGWTVHPASAVASSHPARPYLIVRTAIRSRRYLLSTQTVRATARSSTLGSTYRRREPSDTATGYTCETSSTNGSHSIPLIPPGLDPYPRPPPCSPQSLAVLAGMHHAGKEVGRRIRLRRSRRPSGHGVRRHARAGILGRLESPLSRHALTAEPMDPTGATV